MVRKTRIFIIYKYLHFQYINFLLLLPQFLKQYNND